MTKIIGILNQKGGCGESTLTANVAVQASREGKKVLLIVGVS